MGVISTNVPDERVRLELRVRGTSCFPSIFR